jgi:hypothetical protein
MNVSAKRTPSCEDSVASQSCDMTKRTKKAWTKWRRLVGEQARSGQTVTAFCRERGLCRPHFLVWKKRLCKSAAAKFLEVQAVEPTPRVPADSRIEIRLQNGRSLVVGRGSDVEHVRALLTVVETAR